MRCESAREQQGRGIAARNQEHERSRAKQRKENPAALRVHLVRDRLQPRLQTVEIGIGPRLPSHKHFQFALRLFQRDARPQAGDEPSTVSAALDSVPPASRTPRALTL